jgi:hypothetical protein
MSEELRAKIAEVLAHATPRSAGNRGEDRPPRSARKGCSIGAVTTGSISAGRDVQVISTPSYIINAVFEINPVPRYISDAESTTLMNLVREIVALQGKAGVRSSGNHAVWFDLNRHCGVSSYRRIPSRDFGRARLFLQRWVRRLSQSALGRVEATLDDAPRVGLTRPYEWPPGRRGRVGGALK